MNQTRPIFAFFRENWLTPPPADLKAKRTEQGAFQATGAGQESVIACLGDGDCVIPEKPNFAGVGHLSRQSMTGFGSAQGQIDDLRWTWECRSVNGRGLDLRLRVPDWVDGLETELRSRLQKALARGNVTVSLKLVGTGEEGAHSLDPDQMSAALDAVAAIEAAAMERGITLAPSTAADIAGLRGVMRPGAEARDTETLKSTLLAEFDKVLATFLDARKTEGAALATILADQVDQIEALIEHAIGVLPSRREDQATRMTEALAKVRQLADVDPERVAQELAMIAVKSDVTEEVDRLKAHVAAARDLLSAKGAVGRKLDFLMQEFNREANTLCSKSGSTDLTAIGLDLKAVIEQMREQVQNVE